MGVFIDLAGQHFGRLTVSHRVGSSLPVEWSCHCSCGARVVVKAILLRTAKTRSCGCLRRENTAAMSTTHGMGGGGSRRSPEYRLWLNMRQRCSNPKNPEWAHYGGRGITVCERWQTFETFYADMGPRPPIRNGKQRDYSLERIDNDGPYAPENCRWATYAVQSRNKRNNRMLTLNGETRTVTDWERHTGLQVRQRLNAGWSVDRALTEPAEHHYGRHRSGSGAGRRDRSR